MGSVGLARAVFLDRDGVINKNVYYESTGEWESPRSPDHFEIADGVLDVLRELQSAGFLLFVVSNQPNYAKGKAAMETLNAIHQRLADALDQAGIHFSGFYYCYHHPEGIVPSHSFECDCRKPSPHFLMHAASEFHINLADSWIVGDRDTDIQCGHAAGTRAIRIIDELGNGLEKADYNVSDLAAAAEIILRESTSGTRA
ncbi:MAG TPA: HAD family hydrolase [Acidobacteriaceae bacterium]|nr:HAD family hydrolase [Acidobacteriaceae bacterium]